MYTSAGVTGTTLPQGQPCRAKRARATGWSSCAASGPCRRPKALAITGRRERWVAKCNSSNLLRTTYNRVNAAVSCCHAGFCFGLICKLWILTCDNCTAGSVNVKPAAALLFKFNEGYTNAIKRPVLMHELLQGINKSTLTHL